jgi:hypothetical protein
MVTQRDGSRAVPLNSNGAGNRSLTPEGFFAGTVFGFEAFITIRRALDAFGPVQVRTGRSQVAFINQRGFAYLWLPGKWLKKPDAEVVLSIALSRRLESDRFKEVVHPAKAAWMHHMELHRLSDIDAEVTGWLREAYEDASARGKAVTRKQA